MTDRSQRDTGGTQGAQRAELLRQATYRYARDRGLPEEDAQDCAQEMVVRMLQAFGPALEPESSVRNIAAWMRACVRHQVVDYARQLASERQHAIAFPEAVSADGLPLAWEVPDSAPTPQGALEHEELWRRAIAALDRLDSLSHRCVIRRCLIGQSVEEIATATRQTTNHVYRILARAGQRLQVLLAEDSVTAEDLQPWLPPPDRSVIAPPTPDGPSEKGSAESRLLLQKSASKNDSWGEDTPLRTHRRR